MPKAKMDSSLSELQHECFRFDRFKERWDEFLDWLQNAEQGLTQAGQDRRRLKKVSRDLLLSFERLSASWQRSHDDDRLYMLAQIARLRPLLAGLMWELIRSHMHSAYYSRNINHPRTCAQWYARQILPILWQQLKMEVCDKNWLDLNDHAGRLKSPDFFVCFVRDHLDSLGLTLGMHQLVKSIIAECEMLKRNKILARLGTDLQALIEDVIDPIPEWIEFCRQAVKPVEKNPVDEWFPLAPQLTATRLAAAEEKLLDKVIKDSISSWRKSRQPPQLKPWLEHVQSEKGRESYGRLVVHLMTEGWVVQAYREASDEYLEKPFAGPLHELRWLGIGRTLDQLLRRGMAFEPKEFDIFVRLLQRYGREICLHVPIVSRCEEYAEEHTITEEQRQLLDRYFDFKNLGSNEETKSKKRWDALNSRLKRRAPRKKGRQ